MIEICQLKTTDYAEVYQLWTSVPGMGLNNLDESEAGFVRFLERNPETCFCAKENGHVVGVVLGGSDGRRGHIYHAAVSADKRRQGIGRALVERTIEGFRKIGIHKVCLVAFMKNESGNEFWENAGFHERSDLVYRDRILDTMTRLDT